MKNNSFVFLTGLVVAVSGCASVQDIPKQVWGSSVRALDRARTTAETRTFTCRQQACFDAVLELTKAKEALRVVTKPADNAPRDFMAYEDGTVPNSVRTEGADSKDPAPDATNGVLTRVQTKTLDLFLQDRPRGRMIVMGVPSAVDTTEVGIFFTSLDDGQTRVEISSLSSNAKLNAASIIFNDLAAKFPARE